MEYNLTEKQTEAHCHLTDSKAKAVCYGGAKGGGKSFLLCLWVWQWTLWLIDFFGLEKGKHPPPLGFIGRKRSVDFSDTTFETFRRIIPPNTYLIREQDKEIIVDGKAKIAFGGLDDQLNINKFNSAELAFYFLDQAEETVKNDILLLRAATFYRLTIHGHKIPGKGLLTANPAQCWLKDEFIDIPGVAA